MGKEPLAEARAAARHTLRGRRPRAPTDPCEGGRSASPERRRVVMTAAHSLGLSTIVATSNLLLTAPRRLAEAMIATRSDLAILEAPFEVTPFEIRQQWHERFHQDSGTRWMRELIFSLFRQRPQQGQSSTVADRSQPHQAAGGAPSNAR